MNSNTQITNVNHASDLDKNSKAIRIHLTAILASMLPENILIPFLFSTVVLFYTKLTSCSPTEQDFLAIEGDIVLGGLFPIHEKSKSPGKHCGEFSEIPGYQYMEAMIFAIDRVNEDKKLLKNITLGAQIYDTCRSEMIAADSAKEFIKMTIGRGVMKGQLAGVVGALTSDVSKKVASFLELFEIPQISYASTSVTLSNKNIYSYFLRTVPPDSFKAQAIVDILCKFEWSYISVINSAEEYGTKGMDIFLQLAETKNICIDTRQNLPQFTTRLDYEEVMKRLVTRSQLSNLSVVVVFATEADTQGLLEAAKLIKGSERLTWIGSDDWINAVVKEGKAALGSLSINFHSGNVLKNFKDYYMNLNWENSTRKNRFFREFWEHRFKANLPDGKIYNASCHGNECLTDARLRFSPVRNVINAVYAFSHALDDLQKILCPGQVGMCPVMRQFQRSLLLKQLRNISFQDISMNRTFRFNKNSEVSAMYDILNLQKRNGQYKLIRVGTWKETFRNNTIMKQLRFDGDIKWRKGAIAKPGSFCSKTCTNNAIRQPKCGFTFKCCWDCKQCNDLAILANNTCVSGLPGWVPNFNRTGWVKQPVLYMQFNDNKALLIIAGLSIILTLWTIRVFKVHRNNRIVKASGRELCCVILTGICLCFMVPFLFVTKPNDRLCYTRNLIISVALAMCYAPLFMKINRTYRIFTSAKSSVVRPQLVSPRMQLLLTFGLVSMQLIYTSLWFIARPVQAMERYYIDRKELVLECRVDKFNFSVNLCYVIILMALCTLFAFKTRNYPKMFNESKYIGITMYMTCAVWVVFFSFYLNTEYSLTHAYLISGACVAVGLITLTGLFSQKLSVILFFRKTQNNDLGLLGTLRKIRSEDARSN